MPGIHNYADFEYLIDGDQSMTNRASDLLELSMYLLNTGVGSWRTDLYKTLLALLLSQHRCNHIRGGQLR